SRRELGDVIVYWAWFLRAFHKRSILAHARAEPRVDRLPDAIDHQIAIVKGASGGRYGFAELDGDRGRPDQRTALFHRRAAAGHRYGNHRSLGFDGHHDPAFLERQQFPGSTARAL